MTFRCNPVRPLIAFALCLALATAMAMAQPPAEALPDAAEISAATARSLEGGAALEVAQRYRNLESDRLEAQLALEERTLRASDIQPDTLRAALLARDSIRSRVTVLAGEIAHRRTVLARLQQRITALSRGLEDAAPEGDPDTERLRTALALLGEQARALRALITGFEQLLTADRRFESLNAQRLRLLQSRISLDAIERTAAAQRDPRVPQLEAKIAQLLGESAQLSTQAEAIVAGSPDAAAQRALIDTRMYDTGTRTLLSENDLDLIGLGAQLDALVALREDRAMPARLLAHAQDALGLLEKELQSLAADLAEERQVLAIRRALLQGRGATTGPEWDATAELDGLIEAQGKKVAALLARITPEPVRFAERIAAINGAALSERLPLPGERGDWRRIGAGFANLPALAIRQQGTQLADLGRRFGDLAASDWADLAGGALALIAGTLGLAWWMGRPGRALGRRLAAPIQALAPLLPWAIPALLWAWLGASLDLPTAEWLPSLLVLGVSPACALLLALARSELFAVGLPHGTLAARTAFYRRLRLGLVLAIAIGTVYALTHSLPISPLVADLLDRLAMVGLLLLAVPAFGLKGLVLGLARATDPSADRSGDTAEAQHSDGAGSEPARPQRHGTRLLAWLSRAAALALAAAGLLGLAGFLNLAWAIAADLGWLVLVAGLLHLTRAALDDLYDAASHRLSGMAAASHLARTELWQQQFLDPAYGLAVLAAWLAALWGLGRLWGWSAQTPPLRPLLDWSHSALFHSGHLTLTPRDLALAALLVAGAFWIGVWFRQVSFQLAYVRVRDLGLRHALSIFTQYLVICCGVLLALKAVGLNPTTLLVFAASLGVGIGFGLQNIVNNFISGILLLAERPVRVGDIVTLSGHEGEVTRIGFRSLTIRTFDKQEVFIPNGTLIAGELVNWTRSDDILRTVLSVGIGYRDDPDRAIALVRQILADYAVVLRIPAPLVTLWEFGDSAILLRVEYHSHFLGQVGRTLVRSEVNRRIWYGFQAAGISIPYPQRDLHLYPAPGGAALDLAQPAAPASALGAPEGPA